MKKLYALTVASVIGICTLAAVPAHADFVGNWILVKQTGTPAWRTCDWKRQILNDKRQHKKWQYKTTRAPLACPAP